MHTQTHRYENIHIYIYMLYICACIYIHMHVYAEMKHLTDMYLDRDYFFTVLSTSYYISLQENCTMEPDTSSIISVIK